MLPSSVSQISTPPQPYERAEITRNTETNWRSHNIDRIMSDKIGADNLSGERSGAFGPAVVSHLRPTPAERGASALSENGKVATTPLTDSGDDKVSLSANARELANGIRQTSYRESAVTPLVDKSISLTPSPAQSLKAEKTYKRSGVANIETEEPDVSASGGFGQGVKTFFRSLRSRLWGQAVAAYSQAPVENTRGQRLHIQV